MHLIRGGSLLSYVMAKLDTRDMVLSYKDDCFWSPYELGCSSLSLLAQFGKTMSYHICHVEIV